MKYPPVSNYLNGSFVLDDLPTLEVYNPSEGSVISSVPLSSRREVDRALESARAAFPGWSATPIKERVQIFYR
jgi:malonate-semialdehyde dehydrogenase (acetylating) / methylmalonate-semialdehyde dehydrogenase